MALARWVAGGARCVSCSKCAHFVAACGGNAEPSGREDAEGAEKARRLDERQGAKGAKGRAPRGGWVMAAHVGPPIERRRGARMGPFLRTKNREGVVCPGKSGVKFFLSLDLGGCAKVVPDAHRATPDGEGVYLGVRCCIDV